MRRGSARTLACAAAAVAGLAIFGAGAAQAQRPEKLGNGVKTGQLGVQMFNYGGYISSGGNTGAANPITGVSAACATSTTTECRLERLENLFKFLQSEGVTSIELFGHAGFPASTDTAGLQAYRALMDKYGLHAGGWHGSTNEAQWDARVAAAKILGADYIGSGGVADPGIATYAATLASAQALNRMGKKVRRGRRRPGLHPQPHGRVRPQVRRERRRQDRVRGDHGQHRPALRRGGARCVLVLGRP